MPLASQPEGFTVTLTCVHPLGPSSRVEEIACLDEDATKGAWLHIKQNLGVSIQRAVASVDFDDNPA